MDSPTNHFAITSLMRFRHRLNAERMAELVEERLAGFERFRQLVAPSAAPLGLPTWRADPDYDTRRHVFAVELPDREGALDDYLAALVSRPLAMDRPLWELHVVNGPGHAGVLVSRIHHAIGDGMALLNVLLEMTDEGAGQRRRRRPRHANPARAALTEAARFVLDGARRRDDLRFAAAAAARLAVLTLMPFDGASPFKGRLSTGKRVARAAPISVARVRAARGDVGATVNDVLLSCITGAMARYVDEHGEARVGRLRATIPFNLRPLAAAGGMGNGFTLVYLPLPLRLRDPAVRLCETAYRMHQIKLSPEPVVTNLVLNFIGLLPAPLETVAVRFFGAKASTVITNVPGPDRPLHLDGRPIEEIRFWEPESGSIGIGWSIFSYAGNVFVGVIADAGLIPDPGRLVAGFEAEFAELEAIMERAARRARRYANGPRSRAAAARGRTLDRGGAAERAEGRVGGQARRRAPDQPGRVGA